MLRLPLLLSLAELCSCSSCPATRLPTYRHADNILIEFCHGRQDSSWTLRCHQQRIQKLTGHGCMQHCNFCKFSCSANLTMCQ